MKRDVDGSVAEWSLAEVRRIARRTLAQQPAEIYLFGSWARGEATRTSDIDLAILPTGPIDPGVIAELRWELEESTIPYRVDVVNLDEVEPTFRQRVLKEGIRW